MKMIDGIDDKKVYSFDQMQNMTKVAEETSEKVADQTKNENEKKALETIPVTSEMLDRAVDSVQKISDVFNTHLTFEKDESTGKTIVKVVDSETDEIIRQIPAEMMLKVMTKIQDYLGILIDEKV